jgi:hypothetical protein
LRPPCGRQIIELGAATVFHFAPLSGNPAFFRQAVLSGKEESRTHDENPVCHLLDAVGHADPVQRSKLKGAEEEQIQRSVEELSGFCHALIISTFDIECQQSDQDVVVPALTPQAIEIGREPLGECRRHRGMAAVGVRTDGFGVHVPDASAMPQS